MARSFSAPCGPDGLLRLLADARSGVPAATGGVVFVSGPLGQRLAEVADLVRRAWRGVPACIVPAAGVLSERGEIEAESAASGLLWAGGRVSPFAVPERDIDTGRAARELIAAAVGARAATVMLFVRPDAFAPDLLDGAASAGPHVCLFGAGTVGGSAIALRASGELVEGPVAGLAITGFAPPLVAWTPACRLLMRFEPIEEARGGMVLRAGGRPALDLFSAATADLSRQQGAQPLVLAAIAEGDDEARPDAEGAGDETPRYLVRPIRGVDPARRGVMIGEGARAGARIAFAVRDAAAARAGLESVARQLAQSTLGSAPRFALYVSCAGRGQGLYGATDVEARILRQRFADLPIAGMHSAFEIAPWAPGQARLALYTGVLALFRAPS